MMLGNMIALEEEYPEYEVNALCETLLPILATIFSAKQKATKSQK